MAITDLSLLAAKSSKDNTFLGWALEQFSQSYGYSTADLADYLGCAEGQINKLSLCLLPYEQDPQFLLKVERISNRFEIAFSKLLQLIRESRAVGNLAASQQFSTKNMLLAARDKENSEAEDEE